MRLSIFAIIAVAGLAASHALAESPPPSVKAACAASANVLCKAEVASGKRGQIHACMIRNLAKTPPACQLAIKTVQEHAAEMRAKGEMGEKGDNDPR